MRLLALFSLVVCRERVPLEKSLSQPLKWLFSLQKRQKNINKVKYYFTGDKLPLARLIFAARRNTPVVKQFDPSKPIPNLIEVEGDEGERAEKIKQRWQACPHLRKTDVGKHLCSQFFSNCAQGNCKEKYIQT